MDLIKLVRAAIGGWTPFGQRHCVVCDHSVWFFLPYRDGSDSAPALMNELDVVGSDINNFGCPRCSAHDRERHLLLYLRKTGMLTRMRGCSILHFAPERRLSAHIAAAGPGQYVRCDLFPSSPAIERVDMLAMQFPDASFDVVMANHVLEHVGDDAKALAEVHRVLKPTGLAILQTPYSRKLHHTWEDAGIADAATRLQAFGQEDHVRLYGRDIFERIAAAGFESLVRGHAELLAEIDPRKYGVNAQEPFFLFRKQN